MMRHPFRTAIVSMILVVLVVGGASVLTAGGDAVPQATALSLDDGTTGSSCVVVVDGPSITTEGACPGEIAIVVEREGYGPDVVDTHTVTLEGEGTCTIVYRNRVDDRTAIVEWTHSAAMLESVRSDCPVGMTVHHENRFEHGWAEAEPGALIDVIGTDDDDFAPGSPFGNPS